MTQQEALKIAMELCPDAEIQLERVHCIGAKRGSMEEFKIWDWRGNLRSLATSEKSWEHAIDILRTQQEDLYPQDSSTEELDAASGA